MAILTLSAIAFILTCLALLMLRVKNRYGWLVFIPSYAAQIIIFVMIQNWFLLIQMIVLLVLSVVNFKEWEAE